MLSRLLNEWPAAIHPQPAVGFQLNGLLRAVVV